MTEELILKEESALKNLKEQDLLEGDIFSDGKSFATYRSRSYGRLKLSMNPRANGKVDTIFTGKTVNSYFLLKPRGGRYRFGNSNRKVFENLKSIYNHGLDGLNQDVFNKFQKDIIAPRLIRKIKTTANIG